MKKAISLFLAFVFILSSVTCAAFAGETEKTVTAHGINEISKYGNVKINLSHAEITKYFELGDFVTVTFGDVAVDVPICIAFADVDSGCPGLFCQISSDGAEEVELAVNMGNFAETYGIAVKTVHQDKTYEWNYCEGFSADTCFTITMKEKAGYLEDFTVRSLIYSNERSDFESLTDEQFANFRSVTLGRIADGILYRSASPVDPSRKRNTYADAACEKAGITNFINLGDSEQTLTAFENYAESYYATVSHIAVEASMDPLAGENLDKYAECMRYIIAHPDGIFDVHCLEGKERSGMFIAILGCLMGADYEEIADDYMQSYINYYGIEKGSDAYSVIVNGNFRKTLENTFGTDPAAADLEKEAEEYLAFAGLSKKEILKLKSVLSHRNIVLVFIESIFARIKSFFSRLFGIFG